MLGPSSGADNVSGHHEQRCRAFVLPRQGGGGGGRDPKYFVCILFFMFFLRGDFHTKMKTATHETNECSIRSTEKRSPFLGAKVLRLHRKAVRWRCEMGTTLIELYIT